MVAARAAPSSTTRVSRTGAVRRDMTGKTIGFCVSFQGCSTLCDGYDRYADHIPPAPCPAGAGCSASAAGSLDYCDAHGTRIWRMQVMYAGERYKHCNHKRALL